MACGSCGKARGHLPGCPALDTVPADSRIAARKGQAAKRRAAGESGKCPPHDWYKLASGRTGKRTWRTDQCTKCDAKHTYET